MSAERATQIMPAGDAATAAAARVLRQRGLVAFPTETVYGLGADAENGEAVARLYEAKGRPSFNPLIAHVLDAAAARRLARFDAATERLAAQFWPGPLTLVLPKAPNCAVAELATAGLDTIAVRVPSHGVAREILAAFGGPIVAPSANRSGHVSPTTAAHVSGDLKGRVDLIIDGGPAPMGLESTIVACVDDPVLLRPGALAREAIDRVVSLKAGTAAPAADDDDAVIAPGRLASHYAPRAQLRLDASSVHPDETLLAFGAERIADADRAVLTLNLSARGDLIEAAANFFSHLRRLDACGAATIAVMPIPHVGLGEAINDRLRRAAAPR